MLQARKGDVHPQDLVGPLWPAVQRSEAVHGQPQQCCTGNWVAVPPLLTRTVEAAVSRAVIFHGFH